MSDTPKIAPTRIIRGVDLWETWLSAEHQIQMLADIRRIVSQAPLFEPVTPSGKKNERPNDICWPLWLGHG